jgi:hypothetical protein
MATQVQYRRGTSAQNATFTGAAGELTIDTTNNIILVQDGATVGGFALVGANATQTINNKTYNGTLVSVTGNVTGGNINVTGNIVDTGALGINSGANGNITLNAGTGFIIASSGILNGQANGTGNIGNATGYFNTVFAKATSAQYADLAEMYLADQSYPPGTVLEFGGHNEVTATTQSHTTAIAGVVSTNPSYLMNATQSGEHATAVALVGRVPCLVTGSIRKGDRLVASNLAGVAQAMDPDKYEPGCIIGKALEDHSGDHVSTIEIAVGRN